MKTAQLAIRYLFFLLGLAPVAAAAGPFVMSADGTEVTDQKTGLIWRRCAEGMSWNGVSCAGVASSFTHVDALQYATTQASNTGIAWRLPNVKELSSIADKTRNNPAIDQTAFPATPANVFWTASPSPYGGISQNAWYVNFYNGDVLVTYRINSHTVRLVRTAQ